MSSAFAGQRGFDSASACLGEQNDAERSRTEQDSGGGGGDGCGAGAVDVALPGRRFRVTGGFMGAAMALGDRYFVVWWLGLDRAK